MPPLPPPHCSLQDLPVKMLLEIFALLLGTDLPSLAQACKKFHHILHTDSIWRRRCREEFGVPETLQKPEMMGMSYREVHAKLFHPYRNILGLWQLDHDYRRLLNVAVDGLCITGWTCVPSLNTHVDGPMQLESSFRIGLTERKSATVEYIDDFYSFSHGRLMQIRKDRFSIEWIKRDHRTDSPTRLRGERVLLVFEDRQPYDWLTYRRVYLPSSHLEDLIRPGLFQCRYDYLGLMIAMLSFHGKYAMVSKITGNYTGSLDIHLMRRIQLPDGEFFPNFNKLSRVVQEIDQQVIREQQQQQEDGTEESQGDGWQSPAQPSVWESGAAASEEQPVPLVLPVRVYSYYQDYPRTCRMCFYACTMLPHIAHPTLGAALESSSCSMRTTSGSSLWKRHFILLGRVQNTFQIVEAPSPQAFLEMLWNI